MTCHHLRLINYIVTDLALRWISSFPRLFPNTRKLTLLLTYFDFNFIQKAIALTISISYFLSRQFFQPLRILHLFTSPTKVNPNLRTENLVVNLFIPSLSISIFGASVPLLAHFLSPNQFSSGSFIDRHDSDVCSLTVNTCYCILFRRHVGLFILWSETQQGKQRALFNGEKAWLHAAE